MNGILLIDKPAGWTSMDVCAKLRGALHEKRVGHSGTRGGNVNRVGRKLIEEPVLSGGGKSCFVHIATLLNHE